MRGRYGTFSTTIEKRRGVRKVITREKFEAYVAVQMSGVTNMFNVPVVMSLSGLSKEECLDVMKNYGKYREQFKGGNINDKVRE